MRVMRLLIEKNNRDDSLFIFLIFYNNLEENLLDVSKELANYKDI